MVQLPQARVVPRGRYPGMRTICQPTTVRRDSEYLAFDHGRRVLRPLLTALIQFLADGRGHSGFPYSKQREVPRTFQRVRIGVPSLTTLLSCKGLRCSARRIVGAICVV